MSMEEWPDDHLDELFRKSAEEPDVPFNPADWTDMNRRLTEHDRHHAYARLLRRMGAGALLLLLLGGLLWVAYEGQRKETPPILTQVSKSAAKAPTADKAELRPQAETALATVPDQPARRPDLEITPPAQQPAETGTLVKQPQERPSAIGRLAKQAMTGDERVAHPANRVKPNGEEQAMAVVPNRQRQRRNTYSGTKQPPRQAGRIADGYVPSPAVGAVAAATRLPDPAGSEEIDRPILLHEEKVPSVDPEAAMAADRWLPVLTPVRSQSSLVQQVRSWPTPALTDVPVVRMAQSPVRLPLRRLSVLLFASPDLSAIGLKNFERPGSNAGLAIQYQLTDRLSIHTGAMVSTKRYQTYSDDYVWPSSWVWKVWPSEIIGTCRMIDVPLNIRYDWLLRPRPNGVGAARWFASTGLTSYFIQRETYVYEYDNPNDPNIQGRGWDSQRAGRPGGSFGFSNLNLSVGYERPITRRLSWQVEPFMKVPLQQVGFFRVKLLSTGVFAGLRYRL